MAGPIRRSTVTRALLAGVTGTAAMTLSTAAESRWRSGLDHAVNYDASDHVAQAVGTVLGRPARGSGERRAYTAVAHWGYGSAVALAYPVLRSRVDGDLAAAVGLTLATHGMASALFPLVGGTPPPQRWSAATTASSVVHHAVYSAAVGVVWRLGGGHPRRA